MTFDRKLKMKNDPFYHKEGATFSGYPFWIGLVLIACSVYNLFQGQGIPLMIMWISIAILGIIPLLSLRATRFDFKNKMAFRYFDLLLFKLNYERIDLKPFKAIELRLYAENQGMNMLSISTTVRTRVYELHLVGDDQLKTLIAESTDYAKTTEIMTRISEGLKLEAKNEFEKWKKRNARKRP